MKIILRNFFYKPNYPKLYNCAVAVAVSVAVAVAVAVVVVVVVVIC